MAHRYLWGPGSDELLAQENVSSTAQAGAVVWGLTDNQGSVTRVLDSRGAVQTQLVYDAYGNLVSGDPSLYLTSYTGLERDPTTGLLDTQTRPYDSFTGRFIQIDPIRFKSGTFDLYGYTDNRPTDGVDPTGHVDQGSYSSYFGSIANDNSRYAVTRIAAGTAAGFLTLFDTVPGAIREAEAGAMQQLQDAAATSDDPVQAGMATALQPVVWLGGFNAQVANGVGASSPALATGAAIPAVGGVMYSAPVVNGLTAYGTFRGAQNAYGAIRNGEFTGSDAAGLFGPLAVRTLVRSPNVCPVRLQRPIGNPNTSPILIGRDGSIRLNPSLTDFNSPAVPNTPGSVFGPVSRWGRPGLYPNDWVMPGQATMWNYLRSGKWDPGPWNQFAPPSSGQTFVVPNDSVVWASGLDAVFKGPLGQRKYDPSGS